MIARALVLLGLTGLLLIGPWPVAAQGDETPVVDGFVVEWMAEVIYPQAIRFSAVFGLPFTELTQIELTLQPSGGASRTITLNPAEAAGISATTTLLEYIWAFTVADAPPLFEAVRYEWRTVAADGASASIRDEVIFQDTRVEWVRDEDPQDFFMLVAPADGPDLDRLGRSLIPIYNLLATNTNQTQAFNIIYYPSALSVDNCAPGPDGDLIAVGTETEYRLPCDPAQARALIAASGLDLVQGERGGFTGALAALVNYFTRRFYDPVWADTPVPPWFSEGLIRFYLPGAKGEDYALVAAAARRGNLYDLDAMRAARPSDALWRAQSYAMVLYLAREAGVPALFELARVGEDGEAFDAAYERLMGLPVRALIPDLSAWLRSGVPGMQASDVNWPLDCCS